DNGSKKAHPILGGGRYDYLAGESSAESLPIAGFSVNGAALISYLEGHELLPRFRPMTHVHVLLVGDVHEKARKVVQELRDNGVNVAVDLSGQPVEEQLKTAIVKDVP